MAEIIPELTKHVQAKMTRGEKRVANRLRELLEDDYLVWFDIPVGKQQRYPDFIILHPSRGLLFLEVKDWKVETLKQINKSEVTLLTPAGLVTKPNPLEQVRGYAYTVINKLQKDPQLQQRSAPYKGALVMPYGWGVVFTNITRQTMERGLPEEHREIVLPDHLVMYKDDLAGSIDAEAFQQKLWNMFHYQFGGKLSLPQIDRVRWHLFPEIRIDQGVTGSLFEFSEEEETENTLPDIIKIMDIQQEQLARSMGEGHRVIHGVAGSGKTLILGYRCLHLAQLVHKPILVLCFNVALAARLRQFISSRGIGSKVQVYHFHDWCGQQLKTYQVDLIESEAPVWERQVESVMQAVERGQIPRAQYDALLIDEGHDFEADWLRLVVQMIDPDSDSLLLLYDDAQSIYHQKHGLGFSLSSVGIKAQGRTTILRLNYRNTQEILTFSYQFARQYLEAHSADDDHIPLISPEAAGMNGPAPVIKQLRSEQEEINYAVACIKKWHQKGVSLADIAILYTAPRLGRNLANCLKELQIPHLWMGAKKYKSAYDADAEQVTILTIYSSKGLEFNRVIIIGVDLLGKDTEKQAAEARLLYVGMTRAQNHLLLTGATDDGFFPVLSGQGMLGKNVVA
jgi:hypothetical protein